MAEWVRLRMMRLLANYEQARQQRDRVASAAVADITGGVRGTPMSLPEYVPIQATDWDLDPEMVDVAVREAEAMGHIEVLREGGHPQGPMVRITEQGREYLARDPHTTGGE